MAVRLPALGVLTWIFVLVACGGAERGPAAAIVQDSAGIEIVHHPDAHAPRAAGWSLSDVPRLDIGTVEGSASDQLFRVRGALRLDDGRIVVANAGTGELRFYDSGGQYLSASGRKGAGPGEFMSLSWLAQAESDSLLAFDARLGRLSVFDPQGKYVRSISFHASGETSLFRPVGRLSDGSLVIVGGRAISAMKQAGVVRDSALYLRYDESGALIHSIARLPDGERFIRVGEGGVISVVGRTFAREGQAAVHGDRLYFGSGDRYEVGVYSPEGKLLRLIRTERRNTRVTPEDIERFKEEALQGLPAQARQFRERMLAAMPFPEELPAYARFLTDAEGNLWIQDYPRPGEAQLRWNVFEPDGRLLAGIVVPENFRILQVGRDFVLGRWLDEYDVEHVRLHDLHKSD